MHFQPLGNRVQILPFDTIKVTEGGIIIPEKAQKHDGRGTVISISPDIENPGFSTGDTVIYNIGAASPYEDAGKTYHITPIDYIIAKIN